MPSFCVGFLYDNGNDKIEKNDFQFYQFPMKIILVGLTRVWLGSEMSGLMHYGLTGGWVQKFKGSYLL